MLHRPPRPRPRALPRRPSLPRLGPLLAFALILAALPATGRCYRILFAPHGEPGGEGFGWTCRQVGDIDGNGLADFVIGDPQFDDGAFNTGRAYLYLPTTGPVFPAPVVLTYGQTPGLFGKEVAPAGDVNRDGFDDFVIASENIRALHVFLGAATPAGITRVVIPTPNNARPFTAAGVGDVNADGYDDIVLVAFSQDSAWMWLGSPLVHEQPDVTFAVDAETVCGLEDINGDGFDDFAMGSSNYSVAGVRRGAVYIYLGGAPVNSAIDFVVPALHPIENFGRPMQLGADLNGDGLRDLLVAGPSYGGPQPYSGRLGILYLDPVVGAVQGTSIYGETSHEIGSFAGDADIDLDGIPDVIVMGGLGTQPVHISGFSGAELAGRTAVTTSMATWRRELVASTLETVDDLNGDGYRELLVGNLYDNTLGLKGRAYLLAGGQRQFLNLRVVDTVATAGSVAEVLVTVALDSPDAQATTELSSLDLDLTFDATVATFVGVDVVHPTGQWLVQGAAHTNLLRLALASLTPQPVGAAEQPLLRLRFQAGTAAGHTDFVLKTLQTHASLDLPLWSQFQGGSLSVLDATAAPAVPTGVVLRAYPNPFNPALTIDFVGPNAGPVRLQVLDPRGQSVWHAALGYRDAGKHAASWTGVDQHGAPVASGVYLVRVLGSDWSAQTRVSLVR